MGERAGKQRDGADVRDCRTQPTSIFEEYLRPYPDTIFPRFKRVDWLPDCQVNDTRYSDAGGFEIREGGKRVFSYGPQEGETFKWSNGTLSEIVKENGHRLVFNNQSKKWEEYNGDRKVGESSSHFAGFTCGSRSTVIELAGAITVERLHQEFKKWKQVLDDIDRSLDDYEDVETLKKILAGNEDVRNTPYLDSRQLPTVGIGFNLARVDAKSYIEEVGGNLNELKRAAYIKDEAAKPVLSDDQVNRIFMRTLKESVYEAEKLYGDLSRYPRAVRHVLVDLVFNMGSNKMGEFRNFNQAIKSGEFQRAARHLAASQYARQTGNRSDRNVRTLTLAGQSVPRE